jgi:bifunctional non-homologous end joining protein LigD
MSLAEYKAKRDFRKTPEPGASPGMQHAKPIFVVQEHHATRLHYDFRLEADGVLKSWAVPKGPSLDPSQKRLAVHVEDHPLGYAGFHGDIPEGQYGAGHVEIWDRGTYDADVPGRTVTQGIDAGRLEFTLHGKRLRGRFALIRIRSGQGRKENWLLIKMRDQFARAAAEGDGAARPKKARKAAAPAERKRTSKAPAKATLTHGDKVLFLDAGVTKAEVFDYYRRVAPRLLPYLRDRPVTLERLPDGVGEGKPHFWQKHTPPSYPDWIPRAELPSGAGRPVAYPVVNDKETLLYLVNQGTLTFHPWLSRVGSLDRPDFVLFDLDPGKARFADVVAVAKRLHQLLEEDGVAACVKTSGKSGLHVLTPWERDGGYEEARAWARSVAQRLVEAMPDRATLEIRKEKRDGRVYLDVLQNARGKHVVPPYVLRATPAATVSTPLRWTELTESLDPKRFTVRTMAARLRRLKGDPMEAVLHEEAAAARA